MKQKNLYLTCGIPGSGKSTWIRRMFDEESDLIVSRDVIRFDILKQHNEEKSYFKYENQVWTKFIETINEGLQDDRIERIVIDATHLTTKSRVKILRYFDLQDVNVTILCFYTPLQVALDRNANRTGLAKVPNNVIENMYNTLTFPTVEECEKWNLDTLYVNTEGRWEENERNLDNI